MDLGCSALPSEDARADSRLARVAACFLAARVRPALHGWPGHRTDPEAPPPSGAETFSV